MNWNIWNGVFKAASAFRKGVERQGGETRQQRSGNTVQDIINATPTTPATPIYHHQQSPSRTEQCCPLYHVTTTQSDLPDRIIEEFTDSFQKWGELVDYKHRKAKKSSVRAQTRSLPPQPIGIPVPYPASTIGQNANAKHRSSLKASQEDRDGNDPHLSQSNYLKIMAVLVGYLERWNTLWDVYYKRTFDPSTLSSNHAEIISLIHDPMFQDSCPWIQHKHMLLSLQHLKEFIHVTTTLSTHFPPDQENVLHSFEAELFIALKHMEILTRSSTSRDAFALHNGIDLFMNYARLYMRNGTGDTAIYFMVLVQRLVDPMARWSKYLWTLSPHSMRNILTRVPETIAAGLEPVNHRAQRGGDATDIVEISYDLRIEIESFCVRVLRLAREFENEEADYLRISTFNAIGALICSVESRDDLSLESLIIPSLMFSGEASSEIDLSHAFKIESWSEMKFLNRFHRDILALTIVFMCSHFPEAKITVSSIKYLLSWYLNLEIRNHESVKKDSTFSEHQEPDYNELAHPKLRGILDLLLKVAEPCPADGLILEEWDAERLETVLKFTVICCRTFSKSIMLIPTLRLVVVQFWGKCLQNYSSANSRIFKLFVELKIWDFLLLVMYNWNALADADPVNKEIETYVLQSLPDSLDCNECIARLLLDHFIKSVPSKPALMPLILLTKIMDELSSFGYCLVSISILDRLCPIWEKPTEDSNARMYVLQLVSSLCRCIQKNSYYVLSHESFVSFLLEQVKSPTFGGNGLPSDYSKCAATALATILSQSIASSDAIATSRVTEVLDAIFALLGKGGIGITQEYNKQIFYLDVLMECLSLASNNPARLELIQSAFLKARALEYLMSMFSLRIEPASPSLLPPDKPVVKPSMTMYHAFVAKLMSLLTGILFDNKVCRLRFQQHLCCREIKSRLFERNVPVDFWPEFLGLYIGLIQEDIRVFKENSVNLSDSLVASVIKNEYALRSLYELKTYLNPVSLRRFMEWVLFACDASLDNASKIQRSLIVPFIMLELLPHSVCESSALLFLKVVERVCWHSMSAADLKSILQTMSNFKIKLTAGAMAKIGGGLEENNSPGIGLGYLHWHYDHLLEMLSRLSEKEHPKLDAFLFKSFDSGIRIGALDKWPISGYGFTFICWLYIDRDDLGSFSDVSIFSFTSGKRFAEVILTSDPMNGVKWFEYQVGTSIKTDVVKFEDFSALSGNSIPLKRWVLLSLSHHVPKFPWQKASEVILTLDGCKIGAAEVSFPEQGVYDGNTVGCYPASYVDDRLENAWPGMLSSFALVNDVLSQNSITQIRNEGIQLFPYVLNRFTLEGKMMAHYSPVALHDDTILVNLSQRLPIVNGSVQNIETVSTIGLTNALHCIGGIETLFPILFQSTVRLTASFSDTFGQDGQKQDVKFMTSASETLVSQRVFLFLKTLFNVIISDPEHANHVAHCEGLSVVKEFLSRLNPRLFTWNHLAIICNALKSRTEMDDLYLEIEALLFHPVIWAKTSLDVQLGYFEFIQELIKLPRRVGMNPYAVEFWSRVQEEHFPLGVDAPTDRAADKIFQILELLIISGLSKGDTEFIIHRLWYLKSEALLIRLVQVLTNALASPTCSVSGMKTFFESASIEVFYHLLCHSEPVKIVAFQFLYLSNSLAVDWKWKLPKSWSSQKLDLAHSKFTNLAPRLLKNYPFSHGILRALIQTAVDVPIYDWQTLNSVSCDLEEVQLSANGKFLLGAIDYIAKSKGQVDLVEEVFRPTGFLHSHAKLLEIVECLKETRLWYLNFILFANLLDDLDSTTYIFCDIFTAYLSCAKLTFGDLKSIPVLFWLRHQGSCSYQQLLHMLYRKFVSHILIHMKKQKAATQDSYLVRNALLFLAIYHNLNAERAESSRTEASLISELQFRGSKVFIDQLHAEYGLTFPFPMITICHFISYLLEFHFENILDGCQDFLHDVIFSILDALEGQTTEAEFEAIIHVMTLFRVKMNPPMKIVGYILNFGLSFCSTEQYSQASRHFYVALIRVFSQSISDAYRALSDPEFDHRAFASYLSDLDIESIRETKWLEVEKLFNHSMKPEPAVKALFNPQLELEGIIKELNSIEISVEENYTALMKYIEAVLDKMVDQEINDRQQLKLQRASLRSKIISGWHECFRSFLRESGPWCTESGINYHWKLDFVEDDQRMRRRQCINLFHSSYTEAAARRDKTLYTGEESETKLEFLTSNSAWISNTSSPSASSLPIDNSGSYDDSAMSSSMEDLTLSKLESPVDESVTRDPSEKALLSIECELIVLMIAVKGTLEISSTAITFVESRTKGEGINWSVNDVDFIGSLADLQTASGNEKTEVDLFELFSIDRSWLLSELTACHNRRYKLRQCAIELFFSNNRNYLINFLGSQKRAQEDRALFVKRLLSLRPPLFRRPETQKPRDIVRNCKEIELWRNGEMSNYDYIMFLNTVSGRTYNDLTQYPVFPWIIADYTSSTLDLNDASVYRDLSKPMGALDPERLSRVLDRYNTFEDPSGMVRKFMYGTHYSSSAAVLYYLIRLEPFTRLNVALQGGKFDHPDRQFHSILGCWLSCLTGNDVKELIPEFFCMPEFLCNQNQLNLGTRQRGEVVDDVVLPPWANSAEEFVRINRAALESDYVSAHLHEWIDLIWGYKQTGIESEKSHNVFYFLTYEGAIDVDAIADPVDQRSVIDQINNFGQTPSQLFPSAGHPKRNFKPFAAREKSIISNPTIAQSFLIDMETAKESISYIGFRKTKAGTLSSGNIAEIMKPFKWNYLSMTKGMNLSFNVWSMTDSGDLRVEGDIQPKRKLPITFSQCYLSSNLCALTPNGRYLLVSGIPDAACHIFAIDVDAVRLVGSIHGHHGIVTSLALGEDGRTLILGSHDSTASVWNMDFEKNPPSFKKRRSSVLARHVNTVSSVAVNVSADIVVLGSLDGTVTVFTAYDLKYIRSIQPHTFQKFVIKRVLISKPGLIIVHSEPGESFASSHVSNPMNHLSYLNVYSTNGKHLQTKALSNLVLDMCCSMDKNIMLFLEVTGHLFLMDLENLQVKFKFRFDGEISRVFLFQEGSKSIFMLPRSDGQILALTSGQEIRNDSIV